MIPIEGARWSSTDLAFAVLLLVAGLAFVVLPQSNYMTAIPGDLADARFNNVVLEHVYRWTVGQEPSLWSPRFFYPFPDVLAFSDNHFGSAPVYILLRLLGLDRYDAFNGWFAIGSVLNFVSCCLFLRALGFSGLAAGTGAFLFAFGLPVTGQIGHAQLTYRFIALPALLSLHRLMTRQDLKWLGWLAACVVLQFWCTIYIGVFLILLIAAWIVAFYIVGWVKPDGTPPPHRSLIEAFRRSSGGTRLAVASVSLVAAAMLAFLLGPYQLVASRYGFVRSYVEIATMLPRPISYVLADHSLIWRNLLGRDQLAMFWEHRLFIGLGGSALLLAGLVKGWSRLVGFALAALVCLVAATLSIAGWSAYPALFALPGFNAIRAVSRIWFLQSIPDAIIVAAGTDALTRGRLTLRRAASLLGGVLIVVTAVESSLVVDENQSKAAVERRIDALRAELPAKLAPDAILFLNGGDKANWEFVQLDAMILAQELGVATLNGYSGNFPPGFFQAQKLGCTAGERMLANYVRFDHQDATAFYKLVARVVPVGLNGCDPTTWRLPN